jgi:signal transduction histidine kinase
MSTLGNERKNVPPALSAISHDIIVKQHGGSIAVETQPCEFTEIRIILPRKASVMV